MSGYVPSPPWILYCPWCDHRSAVFARGGRGQDLGSGVEAAKAMEAHVRREHDRTWREFLDTPSPVRGQATLGFDG